MTEYQIAHNMQELKKWANDGYEFVAVITPNDWLMEKKPTINIDLVQSPPTMPSFDSVPKPPFQLDVTIDNPVIPSTTTDGVTSRSKASFVSKPKTIKQIKDGKASNPKSS